MGENLFYPRKRGRPVIASAVCAICVNINAEAHGSAWSRADGDTFVRIRVENFEADLGTVNIAGEDVSSNFQRSEANSYFEYGLTQKITIGGKIAYATRRLDRGETPESNRGISEAEAFGQLQLFRDAQHAGAVKLTVASPLKFVATEQTNINNDGIDIEASLLYGRTLSFSPVTSFINIEAGYRKRLGSGNDQIRFITTIGVEPTNNWAVLIDTYSVNSLGGDRLNPQHYDVLKIQPSLLWRPQKRYAIQFGASQDIAGRNIALGRALFLGFWKQF